MTELKRCPFCGKEQSETNFFSCDGYPQACGCWEMTTTGEEAEKVWNTRPIEDELNARIAQLEAERDELKNELENERDTRKNELGSGLLTTLVNGNALAVRHLKQELAELQLEAELAEWKADAERLIQLANFNNARAGEYFDLHEQLVKKYEVKE